MNLLLLKLYLGDKIVCSLIFSCFKFFKNGELSWFFFWFIFFKIFLLIVGEGKLNVLNVGKKFRMLEIIVVFWFVDDEIFFLKI